MPTVLCNSCARVVVLFRFLQVCGRAFLWHMVRCLMAVLLMVGRGHESPDVMSFLLDLERLVWLAPTGEGGVVSKKTEAVVKN